MKTLGPAPDGDPEFEAKRIASVSAAALGGWSIGFDDGWSFFVPKDSPVAPAVGMQAHLYGKPGHTVRGLYLDGRKVFYRTEAEHVAHEREQRYGKDARDLVRKWDAGETIWSIALGGLGPGYEQALQVAAVEFAREGLDVALAGEREEFYCTRWDEVCERALERIAAWGGGLSGAQYGAAKWLAWQWVHGDGPAALIDGVKHCDEGHRALQVSKSFAHSTPLTAAAPHLLSACESALRCLVGEGHEHYREVAELRAAIALAEGNSTPEHRA